MNQYMQIALNEAKKGMLEGKGGPFGAAVVKEGSVISMASNEVLCSNDPTAHAEIVAIRRACARLQTYDLSGCVIYVTGEPCPMCLAAIIWANIKEVYYALSAKEAEKIGFRDNMIYRHLRGEENVLKIEQLDSQACLKLYEDYKSMGKIIY